MSRRSPLLALMLAATLAGGCERCEGEEPSPRSSEEPSARAEGEREGEAEAPSEAPSEEVELVRRSRTIMSTIFLVTVAGTPEAEAAPAMERALDEIARVEALMSEWQDDSEISAINRAAGHDPVVVSQDTFRVVEAGLRVSEWSEGAFDLSWAALRGLYLFQPGEARIPAIEDVRARLPFVDHEAIAIDAERRAVRLEREGMIIGTGSIAKGYALDLAGAILRDAGIESYMLFGGGQVQVHGLRGDRPWRVGIQHPRDPREYIGFLEASEGSISTSGDYEHAFVDEEGRLWHHIIDLSTGLPATRSVSVTLLAPTGLYADALSTAVFVMGPERALEMLARIPERAEAVILDPDLCMHTTPGTRERMRMRMRLDESGCLPGPREPGRPR